MSSICCLFPHIIKGTVYGSSCNTKIFIPIHRCRDAVASIFQLKKTHRSTYLHSIFRYFVLDYLLCISVYLGACYVVENLNGFEYLKKIREENEVIFAHIKMSLSNVNKSKRKYNNRSKYPKYWWI